MKGNRIHGIVRELRNENIDVINYTTRVDVMIQRALNPAKISSIRVDEENKRAEVFMAPDQVSLAIGKGGHNIKLASKLVGYEIEVFRDTDEDYEDVDLREFNDEIEDWIIDEFYKIGCDTAKSVLALSKEELINRTDLEEETVDDVIRILRAEFEEDDAIDNNQDDVDDDDDSQDDNAIFDDDAEELVDDRENPSNDEQ